MDNDFINDFIEEYKNQPCLWQASSADFKDRKKRQQAYYKLIEVASKHGEHYNIERTKQKINNLRCAFRHQLKKFTESKSSGKSGKDEGYCPKRRYIESLMFLLNEEQPENAKVDNLKTATITPVTKKKANGISKSLNNSNSITSNSKKLLVTNNNKQQRRQQQQQQIICEAIVIPSDSQSSTIDDVTNNEKQNKRHLHQQSQQQHQQQQPQQTIQEVVVKSIEEIRPDTITTQQEDSISQHDPLQIEVHCDDDVKLIWQKSNITSQNPNENSIPIPITSSTPITISNVPISGVSLISAPITTSVPTTTTAAITINNDNNNHSNNNNYDNNRINNINNSNNNSNHQVNTSSITRQRTMSISSQNSSHSIIENAPKKIKIDCSATNFEKLLSLACSKINSINDADDDFTIFGKMVSYKLRSMDAQQALIAEKMITDILLEGQMKMLAYPTRTTTITSYRHDEG